MHSGSLGHSEKPPSRIIDLQRCCSGALTLQVYREHVLSIPGINLHGMRIDENVKRLY
jgi:hypothetical protein